MRTLQEIASKHFSGYLANNNDKPGTTFSFCSGRLKDVRINNIIVANIDAMMDSGKNRSYIITDRYGNSLESLKSNDEEYRTILGY